ncbi:hypothetical protein RJ641_013369 [Dillenia turbinata]|uniref:Uncharacterized protein n=1 Tax=Dillenia turbinata TaxID=194707 RepID=A0AAN8ZUL4_9MAGN
MAANQGHVMMLPWLAFGHMLPFFKFSKILAAKGVYVSFICIPKNIQRLPPIPQELADRMRFVELALPAVDGLPDNIEATTDLQFEQLQYLRKASDELYVPIEKIILTRKPDLIMFHFVHCWIPAIATNIFSAATLAFLGPLSELISPSLRTRPEDFAVAPSWIHFPSLVAYRFDEANRICHYFSFRDVSGLSFGERFGKTLEGCEFVAVRSCREFESEYLNLLEELYDKPVLSVGLLPPTLPDNGNHSLIDSKWSSTFDWLDRQKPKSVVFVGFGTEYKMPIKEIHELASALKASKLPGPRKQKQRAQTSYL